MKKALIIILSFIIGYVIGFSITHFIILKGTTTEKSNTLAFTIADVSKNCLSNSIHVYYDNKYEVYKAYYTNGQKMTPIRTGTYDYDINKILKNISNYKSDEVAYINYKIKINDKEYIVSQREKNELREFIDSINGDELLWCE